MPPVPNGQPGTPAMSRPRRWPAPLAMGLIAATTITIGTGSPGPGLDPDAQSYVGAAVSLVRIGSYRAPTSGWAVADTSEPMTHFPPGFSTAIAGPLVVGVSPLQSARLVIVLAACVTWTALVALLATGITVRAAVLIAVAALCTPAIVTVHLSVLSEPLFLSALMLAMAAMASAASRRTALLAGVFTSAAVMIRYAGLSLTIAVALWFFMNSDRKRVTLGARLERAVLAGAPTAILLVPWLVRSVRLEGASGVRRLGAYGALGATAAEGTQTLASWLVPLGSGVWPLVVAAVIGVGAVLFIWHVRRSAADATSGIERAGSSANQAARRGWGIIDAHRARKLAQIIVITAIAYIGFVTVSRLIADPSIPFDERIMAPALLLIELAIGVQLMRWWERIPSRQRLIAKTFVIAWMLVSGGVTVSRIVFARQDGNDFASSDWRDSPTIAWVRAPTGGATRTLYSNWPPALYFQAHRQSHDLPGTLDRLALHRFRERLARTHGVVVAFTDPSPDVAPPDSIARLLGLAPVARYPDGTVWELPDSSAARSADGGPGVGTSTGVVGPHTRKASS
jgi:hypothetical protein